MSAVAGFSAPPRSVPAAVRQHLGALRLPFLAPFALLPLAVLTAARAAQPEPDPLPTLVVAVGAPVLLVVVAAGVGWRTWTRDTYRRAAGAPVAPVDWSAPGWAELRPVLTRAGVDTGPGAVMRSFDPDAHLSVLYRTRTSGKARRLQAPEQVTVIPSQWPRALRERPAALLPRLLHQLSHVRHRDQRVRQMVTSAAGVSEAALMVATLGLLYAAVNAGWPPAGLVLAAAPSLVLYAAGRAGLGTVALRQEERAEAEASDPPGASGRRAAHLARTAGLRLRTWSVIGATLLGGAGAAAVLLALHLDFPPPAG